MKRPLYACSSNQGKLREFELAGQGEQQGAAYVVQPLPGLASIPPPAETGASFEENAISKAEYYSSLTNELVFADDSGLEVDWLGGAPGVYSARFAGPDATDEANNRLLLEQMRNISERSARFVCTLALAQDGRILGTFRGAVEGEILHQPRGAGGFGYDPLFLYPPFGKTLAEVEPELKLQVSHRGEAMRKLLRYLASGSAV